MRKLFSKTKVKRIIADKGYEDDPLRWRLWNRGIELISPDRSNNKNRVFEDGRKWRRYKRRYIIERTNSWLKNFRRVRARWDRSLTAYTDFVRIACICITLMMFGAGLEIIDENLLSLMGQESGTGQTVV